MAKFSRRGLRSKRPADYGGATSQQPEVTQKWGRCSTSQSVADVLAPCSCCNQLLPTRWLKTTEIDSHCLEARGPKPRLVLPLHAPGENPSMPPPVPGGPRSSLTCSSIAPIPYFIFTWPSPLRVHVSNLPVFSGIALHLGPVLHPG